VALGRCVLDCNDVRVAGGEVDKLDPERLARERTDPCEHAVADGVPAAVRACDCAAARENPDGVGGEAVPSGVEIPFRHRTVEAAHDVDGRVAGRHERPRSASTARTRRLSSSVSGRFSFSKMLCTCRSTARVLR